MYPADSGLPGRRARKTSTAGQTRLGIVSTYVPRRCGLATYTADLRDALTIDLDPVVVAIDRDGLSYPDEPLMLLPLNEAGTRLAANAGQMLSWRLWRFHDRPPVS